jgi:hypothetical protein
MVPILEDVSNALPVRHDLRNADLLAQNWLGAGLIVVNHDTAGPAHHLLIDAERRTTCRPPTMSCLVDASTWRIREFRCGRIVANNRPGVEPRYGTGPSGEWNPNTILVAGGFAPVDVRDPAFDQPVHGVEVGRSDADSIAFSRR